MNKYLLKIITDIHCEVYIDQEFVGIVKKGIMAKIPLDRGEYFVQIRSIINCRYQTEWIMSMEHDKVISVMFKELSKIHPEWTQDTDYRIAHDDENLVNIITGEVFVSHTDYTFIGNTGGIVFKDGVAVAVNSKDKWGIINRGKKEVVPCIYDYAIYSEGIVAVEDSKNRKWLFFDINGNLLFEKAIKCCGECENGYMIAYDSKGSLIIDRNGNERRLPDQDQEIYDYSENRLIVREPARKDGNSNYILVDIESLQTIEPEGWSEIYKFSDGIALVKYSCYYTHIDKDGMILHKSFGCKKASNYSEGLAAVVRINHDKYGYINKDGMEIISSKYDDAGSFSEGLAWVKFNGKCGYINKDGKVIIDFLYDDAWDFSKGLAEVSIEEELFYIDKYGNQY